MVKVAGAGHRKEPIPQPAVFLKVGPPAIGDEAGQSGFTSLLILFTSCMGGQLQISCIPAPPQLGLFPLREEIKKFNTNHG